MSKGSARRPAEVPSEVVDANWDNIFGKKDKPEAKDIVDQSKKDSSCTQATSDGDGVVVSSL